MELSFHPNGFLQITGGNGKKRVHVWSSDVPRQIRPTLIHNHRFEFTSRILYGTLLNVRYRIVPGFAFYRHTPLAHEGRYTELIADGTMPCSAEIWTCEILTEGQSYHMSPYEYHMSIPWGFCVTEMTKIGENGKTEPSVLVPTGYEPDNEFTRHVMLAMEED